MKRALIGFFVFVLAAWLLVPAGSPAVLPPADARPFLWDQDEIWSSLEDAFLATRESGCDVASERIDIRLDALADDVEWLETESPAPADARFDALEDNLFAAAPLVAACPEADILANNNAGPPPGLFENWGHAEWLAGLEANLLAPGMMIRGVQRRFKPSRASALVRAPAKPLCREAG